MSSPRPLESKITRRFAPFAAIGLLALLAPLLPPRPSDWTYVWIAAALTLIIAAAGFLVPWSKLPRWSYLVPPLAYLVVVACLRQAHDGSASGYAALALLPVVWIALNLGRGEVAIGIGVGASVFVLPLIVGDPASYTTEDWRRAVLWTAVAVIVGYSVEALVREKRTQTRTARDHAAALADHQRTLAAIADVTRALDAGSDTRAQLCQATLGIVEASSAATWEPDESGDLVVTGQEGDELDRSGAAHAFSSGQRSFVAGVPATLFEPIRRDERVIGVLGVGWSGRVGHLDERTTQAVEALAIDAASAIERADLLAALSRLADTDELTGLPNRRAWDETIGRAVGYAGRTRRSLCVALVDLDRFKQFNDLHGHQAGDRLLESAAAAWRTALRQTDTLARYGGEEFAISLPSCTAAEAEVVLDRLRALTPEGQTCSIGLAEWIDIM